VSAQIIQGWACRYGEKNKHWYHKNQRFESFDEGCFAGSLWGVWLGREHRYSERKIATQDDDSLELLETSEGLAFRAKLKPGDVEWIGGRSEASVSYVAKDTCIRKGIHTIKSAAILEIGLCHVATIRSTFALVCDANSVGTLEYESKNNFGSDAAFTKVMAALRNLDSK
jgi:hypothetical protein